MHKERFRWDNRKDSFSARLVMQWYRLPHEVLGSLFLELFHNWGNVALRDTVSGLGGWVGVGLGDLRGVLAL